MEKTGDQRKDCKQCLMVYGMEEPKMTAIRDSKHFIALTADDPRKPSTILIVPKIHLNTLDELREKDLRFEGAALVLEVLSKCRKNCGMQGSQEHWRKGPKMHLHIELTLTY